MQGMGADFFSSFPLPSMAPSDVPLGNQHNQGENHAAN
jgi:hypothetical protein